MVPLMSEPDPYPQLKAPSSVLVFKVLTLVALFGSSALAVVFRGWFIAVVLLDSLIMGPICLDTLPPDHHSWGVIHIIPFTVFSTLALDAIMEPLDNPEYRPTLLAMGCVFSIMVYFFLLLLFIDLPNDAEGSGGPGSGGSVQTGNTDVVFDAKPRRYVSVPTSDPGLDTRKP